jgi:hypothetical protein
MTQIPISGRIIKARPRPMAAGRPEVMNAIAMRPSITKYTTRATHMKPITSWMRCARPVGHAKSRKGSRRL